MESGFFANFGYRYRCRILEVKKRKIFAGNPFLRVRKIQNIQKIKNQKNQKIQRAKRRLEGPKGSPKGRRLEVGDQGAPELLVTIYSTAVIALEIMKFAFNI